MYRKHSFPRSKDAPLSVAVGEPVGVEEFSSGTVHALVGMSPEKIPLWFDSFKKCEYATEIKAGVGTGFYVEEKVPGPLRKINFEAVTWDENEKLTLRMTSGANVDSYEIRWDLKPAPSGSVFHFVEDVGMPFGVIGKLLGVLGRGTADRMVTGMLVKLKQLSEGGEAPTG